MTLTSILFLAIIIFVIWRNCRTGGNRIEINHVFCFSAGYIFYCLLPIWCYLFIRDLGDPGYDRLERKFNSIPWEKQMGYLAVSFVFYMSFVMGVHFARKFSFRISSIKVFYEKKYEFNGVQKVFFIPVFLLGVLLLIKNRMAFGIGYTGQALASATLSAYEFLLNAFVLMYICTNCTKYKVSKLFMNKWVIWFATYSLLLLTTGGRLYVVTAILSEVVFYSCIKKNGLNTRKVIFAGLICILAIGAIGMMRLGVEKFGISGMIVNVFGESLYTNWSAVTYIKYYPIINLFGKPQVTLSAFINVIPSFLFPNKTEFMQTIMQAYPRSEAPGGAAHFYLTFNGGLGTFISIAFFFMLGAILERIHIDLKQKGVCAKVVYCFVTANLLFTLYRDPFSVSVVKNIIELSVVVPWVFIIIGHKLTQYQFKSSDDC